MATALVAVLLLLSAGYLTLIGTTPARAPIGGPFALVSGDGRTVTDRDFRGRFMLIYFGYTECRDVCPVTLSNMAAAMAALGPRAAEVQPLFITVDPARDTPDIVQRYTAAFMPELIGLTGSAAALAQVQHAYRVVSSTPPDHGAMYAVDHSSVIYLVDRAGRYVAPIPADGSGPDIARRIAAHLS